MVGRRCPDDIELEKLIYEDLPPIKKILVKRHVERCGDCKDRFARIKRFNEALSRMASVEDPALEPPPELLAGIMGAIDNWSKEENDDPASDPYMVWDLSLKLRLALSAFLMAVAGVFQWRLDGYFTGMALDSYFVNWHDLVTLFELFRSGFIWESVQKFFMALRTDGLSAIGILSTTLPIFSMSVILCGAVVTIVFIKGWRSARSGGDKV